jgi:hypothetical protein
MLLRNDILRDNCGHLGGLMNHLSEAFEKSTGRRFSYWLSLGSERFPRAKFSLPNSFEDWVFDSAPREVENYA